MGSMALGIVLSPRAWTAFHSNKEESFKITLWHEMNHFIYFSNFDFINLTKPDLWFTEGLAEYFADNESRLDEVNNRIAKNYSFTTSESSYDSYWVGYTAFLYFEKQYGVKSLSDLIKSSYSVSLQTATQNSSAISLKEWETGWRKNISTLK